MFKEVADIKTSDQLHLPVPDAKFETVVAKPSEIQKEMVQELSKRAAKSTPAQWMRPRTICCASPTMAERSVWMSA